MRIVRVYKSNNTWKAMHCIRFFVVCRSIRLPFSRHVRGLTCRQSSSRSLIIGLDCKLAVSLTMEVNDDCQRRCKRCTNASKAKPKQFKRGSFGCRTYHQHNPRLILIVCEWCLKKVF